MHDDGMASDVDEYWDRRREIVPSPERPTVADGDRRLALLANVADDKLADRFDRLSTRLDEFSCLRPTPADELHLTAKVFDRRVRDVETADGVPSVGAVDTLVRDVLEDVAPFDVAFPRLNLFPDAVYAEVEDDGVLSAVNETLCASSETLTVDRDAEQFLPHLTLGYFTGDEEYHQLVDFLEANRELSFPATTVTEFHLVEYDVTAEWPSATSTLRTYSL